MKKYKLPKRQTGHLTKAIIYGAIMMFCLTDMKRMWAFFLIFLVISVFYAYLWWKHRHDKSLVEVIKATLKSTEDDDEAEEELSPQSKYARMNKKEQKKTYQDYLAQLDKEFEDEELDRQLAEAEEEYDEFGDNDLYIK